jgi:hypothetical protein
VDPPPVPLLDVAALPSTGKAESGGLLPEQVSSLGQSAARAPVVAPGASQSPSRKALELAPPVLVGAVPAVGVVVGRGEVLPPPPAPPAPPVFLAPPPAVPAPIEAGMGSIQVPAFLAPPEAVLQGALADVQGTAGSPQNPKQEFWVSRNEERGLDYIL